MTRPGGSKEAIKRKPTSKGGFGRQQSEGKPEKIARAGHYNEWWNIIFALTAFEATSHSRLLGGDRVSSAGYRTSAVPSSNSNRFDRCGSRDRKWSRVLG